VGFLKSLYSIIYLCKPDKVIITWDGEGGSAKRKQLDENYKAKRKPSKLNRAYEFNLDNPEENLAWQRVKLADYLDMLPVCQILIKGVEADDIISWVSRNYPDDEKIIVSN